MPSARQTSFISLLPSGSRSLLLVGIGCLRTARRSRRLAIAGLRTRAQRLRATAPPQRTHYSRVSTGAECPCGLLDFGGDATRTRRSGAGATCGVPYSSLSYTGLCGGPVTCLSSAANANTVEMTVASANGGCLTSRACTPLFGRPQARLFAVGTVATAKRADIDSIRRERLGMVRLRGGLENLTRKGTIRVSSVPFAC